MVDVRFILWLLIFLNCIQNVILGITVDEGEFITMKNAIHEHNSQLELVLSKLQTMNEKITFLQGSEQKLKTEMLLMKRLKDAELIHQLKIHDQNLKEIELKLLSKFERYERRIQSLEGEIVTQRQMNIKQNDRVEKLQTKMIDLHNGKNLQAKLNGSSTVQSAMPLQKQRPLNLYSDCESMTKKEGVTLTKSSDRKDNMGLSKRLLLPATTSPPEALLPTVAFHAYLSKTEEHLTAHHTLVFDQVMTNAGNGYNKHSGSFLVPRSGIYVFTWTLVQHVTGEICTNIVINGVDKGNSYAHTSSNFATTTSIVVVHVEQGDTVLIRTNNYSGCNQAGSIMADVWRRSTFSGWLLG